MKKTVRKLQLARETVRVLEPAKIGQALGGYSQTGPSCLFSCTCFDTTPGHTCSC